MLDISQFEWFDNRLVCIEQRLAEIASALRALGTDIGAIEALDEQIRKSGDKIVEQIQKSTNRIAEMMACLGE